MQSDQLSYIMSNVNYFTLVSLLALFPMLCFAATASIKLYKLMDYPGIKLPTIALFLLPPVLQVNTVIGVYW